jgi:hypothetical protein
MDSLPRILQAIPRRTGLASGEVGVLLGISILCLGGFLFSYTLSIDDELTIISREASILWHFQVGRFMLGLLRRGFWPSTHPFIAYASLAVAYVASYALILDLHHLRHSWRTTLAFFIFIAFPTNWLLQEFPVTAFSLSFGLVLAPLAAIETLRIHQGPSAGRTPRLPLSPLVIVLLLVLIGFFPVLSSAVSLDRHRLHSAQWPALPTGQSQQNQGPAVVLWLWTDRHPPASLALQSPAGDPGAAAGPS